MVENQDARIISPTPNTRFDLSLLSRATVITARLRGRTRFRESPIPSDPSNPVMVACVALPVLKPATEMVTLKLLGLYSADLTRSTLAFLPCFWVTR